MDVEKSSYCSLRRPLDSKPLTLDDSLHTIRKQEQEISRLNLELSAVKCENNVLANQVMNLKYELETLKTAQNEQSSSTKYYANTYNAIPNASDSNSYTRYRSQDHDNSQLYEHDDEYTNGKIDDVISGEGDLKYQVKSFGKTSLQYHEVWHKGRNVKSSVCNTSEIMGRSQMETSYELSQDLLDKKLELLERKYGGAKAREAAIIIQRAFRRYVLLKKFAQYTEMAKAEKFSCSKANVKRQVVAALLREHPNRNISNASELSCEMKMSCMQANVTPIRSSSMREKRLGELDFGANSLPRAYLTKCDYANCCNTVCLSCQQNACPEHPAYSNANIYYTKTCHGMEMRYPPSCSMPGTMNGIYNNQCGYLKYKQAAPQSQFMQQPPHIVYHNATPPSHQVYATSSHIQSHSTPKKVPPEVPKRTSSISLRCTGDGVSNHSYGGNSSDMNYTQYSGSVSSVQSSSSDSSSAMNSMMGANSYTTAWDKKPQISDTVRKRQYRVGLNLFNKKPEKGINFLIQKGFLEGSPQAVAKFIYTRKGLSKQMIGEYLGNFMNPFNSAVLEHFVAELELSGMQIDVALRKFQTYFRMPGEAQKIERLMQVFSRAYSQCNKEVVSIFRSEDTVFILAFAIIMLNTDLHTPNMKNDKRMKLEDFIKNLRGIDDGKDIHRDMLVGIYDRIKGSEFKSGSDHVLQVMKVQNTIVGHKMNLAVAHRRLVCYCRLYEVQDANKKERAGLHQREVFLFNDLLIITKILSKKKNAVTYSFRQSLPLIGLIATTFETQHCLFGIQLSNRASNDRLITFNARNDHDRSKFIEDIRESIAEMDEMDAIRLEGELERQKNSGRPTRSARCSSGGTNADNRDSGVADVEVYQCLRGCSPPKQQVTNTCNSDQYANVMRRSGRSNSLLDMHDQN